MEAIILGGTFNPVHMGHLFLAEEIKLQTNCRQIIFIPSCLSAHKESGNLISSTHRFNMLRLALEGSEFILDDCEIKRGGISYSIDTIDDIKKRYNITGNPGLVIGDDLLKGFKKWKQAEKLSYKTDLLVVHRLNTEECYFPYVHQYINNMILPVSSSDIRNRIYNGKAYRYIIQDSVYKYVQENRLYHR